MILTSDNYNAINESVEFENNSFYKDLICGREISKGGPKLSTIMSSLIQLRKIGLTDEEYNFFMDRYNNHSKPICCLPKNHDGTCQMKYENFISEKYHIKTKDSYTGPGDDDIIFKNRYGRTYPIQISNSQESILKRNYDLKNSNLKLKAAIPIKQASTPFMVASSQMDICAFINKIEKQNFPKYLSDFMDDHFNTLKTYFEKNNIYITDDDGDLCCPVMGVKILPNYINENAGDNQIQFGHVESIRNDRYMTRGMNVIFITRRGNLIQSDDSLFQIRETIERCYNHTKIRVS
jgi:hypothetical protein